MNQKAQTTMELMILLIISVLALVLIYAMYSEQVSAGNFQREQFAAKNSLSKITNAANLLVLSGVGSKAVVDVEFLSSTRLDETTIFGDTILLTLSNGTNLFASADINFSGSIRDLRGKHEIKLYYDGNTVLIYYGDFEVNQQSVSISLIAGLNQVENIIIKNSNADILIFYVEKNFSYSDVSLELDEELFYLAPDEIKTLILNFDTSLNANGNYVGDIKIIATVDDKNIEQVVNVSVEALQKFTPILISPYSTEFITYQGAEVTKNISICNKTLLEIDGVIWSKNGTVDANASEWFDLPAGDIIIPKNECVIIPIIFNVPVDAQLKEYGGNLTAQVGEDLVTTSFVVEIVPVNKIFLQSTTNSTLLENFSKSFFVKQNELGYLIPTGEIDWNTQKDFSLNGEDWDNNLVAYYKFNDTNGTHVFDSARGNDGVLVNDANINAEGLWDSNSLQVNGSNAYVALPTNIYQEFSGDINFTFSAWYYYDGWDASSSAYIIGLVGSIGGNQPNIGLSIDSDEKPRFGVRQSANSNSNLAVGVNSISVGWHHFLGTYNAIDSEVKIYLDSVLVGSDSTNLLTFNGSDFDSGSIGSFVGFSTLPIKGKIDEVKMWNKALTPSEIIADYNSFLSAKFADLNIIDAERVVDWNSFFINKDEIFVSEQERMQLDFNFFTCDDLSCNNKTSSMFIADVNNSIIKNLTDLDSSRYLGFEVFFNKRNGFSSNIAGDFYKIPFLKDINILVN